MFCSRASRALLGVLAVSVTVACSDSGEEPGGPRGGPGERKPQPVLTATAEYAYETTSLEAVGTSRALKSVTIESAVSGEVVEVNFSAGDKVEQGQVLLRLDDRDERLAVQAAELELADAERQLDRYQRSVQSGGVTQSDLDDARSAVERARIALERARVDLNYHTIRAPFSGYVGLTDLDPGAWIDPDTAITTLDDRSTLLVRFELPELLLGKLQRGEDIEVTTWSNRFAQATGTIVDVSSRVDEVRRTFTLRAHVDNANDVLLPGMSFRINLSLQGNRYLSVPELSVQWGGEGAYVWTIEDGKAQRVAVNLIERNQRGVLVETDLQEGAPIITEGVHIVRSGMDVRPLNAELGENDGAYRDSGESEEGEES
ncbi:efflux RND transporter periplasmic adaptor subunit [Marinimicrobium koreense]|nr:efflux RND transporter periplasmic adaptor subunit [Marinimicrobium koreense]